MERLSLSSLGFESGPLYMGSQTPYCSVVISCQDKSDLSKSFPMVHSSLHQHWHHSSVTTNVKSKPGVWSWWNWTHPYALTCSSFSSPSSFAYVATPCSDLSKTRSKHVYLPRVSWLSSMFAVLIVLHKSFLVLQASWLILTPVKNKAAVSSMPNIHYRV